MAHQGLVLPYPFFRHPEFMETLVKLWLLFLQDNESWRSLAASLLETEPVPDPSLSECNGSLIQRPFYCAFAKTLQYCMDHQGQFPPALRQSPWPTLLPITNSERIRVLEKELGRLARPPMRPRAVSLFLIQFLTPADARVFLGLRSTTGGQDLAVMPPSLVECWATFRARHAKAAGTEPCRQLPKPSLTVGAKALSKHWHRDRGVGFWGNCTAEQEKNGHADHILSCILSDAVWINLHHLPHHWVAYEVRQHDGYGARWSRPLTEPTRWQFRGFLEPPMEDGHNKGWVHGSSADSSPLDQNTKG